MMPIYREIKLFDDTGISLGFIWQKLYERLHIALVPLKDADGCVPVGFTFPGYKSDIFPLGNRLRIFAPDESKLKQLNLGRVLSELSDYTVVSEIRETPASHRHVIFRRKQFKTNPQRMAKRYAKRHGITLEEALKRYSSYDAEEIIEKNRLPYFNLNSLSTGQRTRVFIEKKASIHRQEGLFNTFGLSKGATLPDF